jgi:hypothetical protein
LAKVLTGELALVSVDDDLAPTSAAQRTAQASQKPQPSLLERPEAI